MSVHGHKHRMDLLHRDIITGKKVWKLARFEGELTGPYAGQEAEHVMQRELLGPSHLNHSTVS